MKCLVFQWNLWAGAKSDKNMSVKFKLNEKNHVITRYLIIIMQKQHTRVMQSGNSCTIQGSHLIGYLWVSSIVDQSECLDFTSFFFFFSFTELPLFCPMLPENYFYLIDHLWVSSIIDQLECLNFTSLVFFFTELPLFCPMLPENYFYLIDHLWVSSIIDQSECLDFTSFFFHWITSVLPYVTRKLLLFDWLSVSFFHYWPIRMFGFYLFFFFFTKLALFCPMLPENYFYLIDHLWVSSIINQSECLDFTSFVFFFSLNYLCSALCYQKTTFIWLAICEFLPLLTNQNVWILLLFFFTELPLFCPMLPENYFYLIGYLWVSSIIDQSECLDCISFFFCTELPLFCPMLPENCFSLAGEIFLCILLWVKAIIHFFQIMAPAHQLQCMKLTMWQLIRLHVEQQALAKMVCLKSW